MPRLVNIALPLPLFRTFTYAVPDELSDSATIGSRVLVPFGRRTMTGFITDEIRSTDLKKIRPIQSVLDRVPLFSPNMLAFAEWMSGYYVAPLGETLRTMVPAGLSAKSGVVIRLTETGRLVDTGRLRRSAPRQSAIIAALGDNPNGIAQTRLAKLVGAEGLSGPLSALVEKGYIELQEKEPNKAAPKTKNGIRLSASVLGNDGLIHDLLDELDRRAPKQAALLLHLLANAEREENAPILQNNLLEQTGVSASVLEGLRIKGIAETVPVEVSREELLSRGLDESAVPHDIDESTITSNDAQRAVIDRVTARLPDGFAAYLLHGVTGSGKTHVYIELIRNIVERGAQAILLVPEIALTVQLVDRFRSVFGDRIVLTHSRMSDGERYDGWRRAVRGECDLVIGPRSALFAPLPNLGLIVVDEEHESSYKQYDAQPRYNARDAAVVRSSIEGCPVLLGSATPSIESYYNTEIGKYELLELPDRVDSAKEPSMRLVDTRTARKQNLMRGSLSTMLIKEVTERIGRSEGTILFQNRRGFASRLECTNCGHAPMCEHCAVTLTFHKGIGQLKCHYCGYERRREQSCEVCGAADLREPGIGTERVERDVAEHIPQARVRRMDLDTTSRKGSHRAILDEFARGEIDVLLGTQMVAKGLDFPRVSLVGVVSADTQLMLPDLRSGERTFQLITQVAGRAGRRSDVPGEVLVQSGHPENPAITTAFRRDYHAMYETELRDRRALRYPPFSRFILIEFRSKDEGLAEEHGRLFRSLLPQSDPTTEILGPTAALLWKLRDWYRFQIHCKNIKANDPGGRHFFAMFKEAWERYRSDHADKRVDLIVDVDAQSAL